MTQITICPRTEHDTYSYVLPLFHLAAFRSTVATCRKEMTCQCSWYYLLPVPFANPPCLFQFVSFLPEGPRRRPEGGEWEPNKILSQEPDLCPLFKTPSKNTWSKVMKNTNQQDRNDPYKVTKPVEEEWDKTDTRLAKYGQNSERVSG
jgi:hypothetical protein